MNPENKPKTPTKLFIPSLALSGFAVSISATLLTLLTVDIASELHVSVALAAQITTINSLAELVMGLFMGFLALKFRHKSLYLWGVLLVTISAIGCYLAPTYPVMQFFFILEGAGTMMVTILGYTLIGDTLTQDKKPKAMSYLVAAVISVAVISTPIMAFLANTTGWRSVFTLFVLPTAVVALTMAAYGIPQQKHKTTRLNSYRGSFKLVFREKSAAFSLLGNLLMAPVQGVGLFVIALFREQFLMPLAFAAIVVMSSGVMWIAGSLVAGRLTNRFGSKALTTAGFITSGFLLISLFLIGNVWLSLILNTVHVFLFGIAFTASRCLIMDQVKTDRSTMLSMSSVIHNIGSIIGPIIGGATLLLFSYQAVGFVFGLFGISSALIFYFLTKDPYNDGNTPLSEQSDNIGLL